MQKVFTCSGSKTAEKLKELIAKGYIIDSQSNSGSGTPNYSPYRHSIMSIDQFLDERESASGITVIVAHR